MEKENTLSSTEESTLDLRIPHSDALQLSHRDSMVSQAITKSRVTYATDWFKTTHMLKRICFWCYWLDVDPYPLRQCLIKITTLGYFCKSFILPQPFCPVYSESKKKSGIFHVTFHHLRLLPRTDKGKFLFLKFMVMSSNSENKSTKSVPVTLTRFCFCFCFFF